MADIFLSYSRTDKPRVAPLVAALESKGWDVWWDMALVPGEEFDNVTAQALETARSVVVVWTPTSVASRWVRGEARVGADRNVLVPARFDGAQLPIDLRAIQTTDMDDWGGDPQSAQFQTLHQSLLAMLGAPAKAGAPCVGRMQELERVRELLGKVKRGQGGFLLFSGEAGIGKSRMILEAERMALDAGFNVLKGHCANSESPPPFQPALEQIEQTARRLGPDLMRQSMGDNAAEISRLMPELKQRYTDIPEYPTLPPEQERRYLLHGIAEFVARGAARQPLVLVFEDLHWADESTCVLLAYVADRLKNDPVLMIGAFRDSEVGEAPFGRTLQELLRKRLAEDIRLRRLTSAHIVELLSRQFGSEPPSSLVELIFSKTEGNPFFVEEVVRHLVDTDKLLTAGGKFRDRVEVTDAEVTRGVRFILEERIGPVGTPCRDVMTIAAVIGRTFAFELLAKTDGARSEDDVLDAVEEAERKHLIEDVSREREARYQFVHEQVRQTLIAGLSVPRRQRLHLRIADALEARFAGRAEKVAGEIGHHLYQAGSAAEPLRTAHHLSLAGEKGVQALAFEDALRQFDLALKVLEDSGDGAARAKLHSHRAVALRGAERFAEALDALTAATAAASTQEAKDNYALERCRLLLGIWRGAEAIGDLEALLARAIASADPARELSVQRVVARAYYVMSLDHKAYTDKCRSAYERAIALARGQGDNEALGASLVATAQLTDYWPEFRSQAEQNLAEAAQIARETANDDLEIDVATATLSILVAGPRVDEEERMLSRLLERRDPIRLNAFYFRMMWSTYGNGRLQRCTEICAAGIELAYRIGTLPVQYPTIRGLALIELGRFGDAWASFDKEIADPAHRFGAAIRDLGRMHYTLQVGAHDEAMERAKHVIAESLALSRAWMLRWVSQDLAELAFDHAGDPAIITKLEALIAATGTRVGAIGAAALNIAKGDYPAAASLQGSAKGADWVGVTRFDITRAQLLAHLEMSQGNHVKALEWIKKAVACARQTGAEHRLWRALGEQALIEEAMRDAAAASTRAEAQAIWSKGGATIPDPEHRAVFMRGPLPLRLRLIETAHR